MTFDTGTQVAARGLAWDVLETERLGAQHRLRLRCAAGDLRGLEWDFLYPAEPVQPLQTDMRPEAPAPLNAWRLHHIACLLEQSPGPGGISAAEPGRVTIEPYQLVPLMRALEMPRPRLLLADGVGLGKTVQAGLIATEWIARRRAHRILVVAPAGPLLVQWAQELRQRFGLRFTAITDGAALNRERRRVPLGGNPFDGIALCLIALDFAKQERVLEDLERAAWDLAIIDEAHHCIGGLLDAEATLRRRLAETVARRSDGLLLLTATPHDGYDAHFASLIALLDPALVDGRGGLAGAAYRRHVVRRLKSHIRNPATGEQLFRARTVIPVRIEARAAAPVQAFHAALAALVAPRLRRARDGGDPADALAFVSLLKRSVSTIAACVATLGVVAERYGALRAAGEDAALRKERARALRAYRRRRLRYGVLDAAAETNAAMLEAEDVAAGLYGSAGAVSRGDDPVVAALRDLVALGAAAAALDPKLAAMRDEVRLIRAAHPRANVLVYTEYADSQAAAVQALSHAAGVQGEVLAIGGLDAEAARVAVAERFAEQDGLVLVSTDSMAEGLNLQRRCCHLIHLDLPYNPNRLEQRNGRIDRYGQTRDPEIRYLYLAGTFEERLLLRLIAKYEKARARLDVMPDTLGVTADEAAWEKGLVAGFAEDQAGLFEDAAPAVRTLDHAAEAGNAAALRDLVHEIDRAFEGFERDAVRHGWLAEQGANADLRQMRAADQARARGEVAAGGIDLADFVAAAIAMDEAPAAGADPARLHLPGEWSAGLDGLPGFDAATATLRITRDRDRLLTADGESLAFLGRAHPIVRRAIGRVRRPASAGTAMGAFAGASIGAAIGASAGTATDASAGTATDASAGTATGASASTITGASMGAGTGASTGASTSAAGPQPDIRVGVAHSPSGSPAVLLTFAIEIAGARRIQLQQVVAVLLPRDGPLVPIESPAEWLGYAGADRTLALHDAWNRHFASWVPKRRAEGEALATATMRRIADAFARARQVSAERDRAELDHWLKLRADDICGPWQPRTGDLFGRAPEGPAWKLLPAPPDRLAAYAGDAETPPAKRREANSVLVLLRHRTEEQARDGAMAPARLRPIGMLMLAPAA